MIVDASVAARWFLDEPGAEGAQALLHSGEPLFAPDLILVEVAGALRAAVFSGAIDRQDAFMACRRLGEAFEALTPSTRLAPRALELALDLKLGVSACCYLALAEERGEVLVSADRVLIHALRQGPFAATIRLL